MKNCNFRSQKWFKQHISRTYEDTYSAILFLRTYLLMSDRACNTRASYTKASSTPTPHPQSPPTSTPRTSLTQQLTILKNKQRWNSYIYIFYHNNLKKFHEHIEGFRQIQWWRECYVCNIRMAKNSFKGNKFEHQCVWHIKEVSARQDQNCNSIEVGQTFQKP